MIFEFFHVKLDFRIVQVEMMGHVFEIANAKQRQCFLQMNVHGDAHTRQVDKYKRWGNCARNCSQACSVMQQ